MRALNVGCGSTRPGEPWTNLDNLRTQLPEGTPERANLDAEPNYVEHDISAGELPFPEDTFSICLLSHVIEHFDCKQGMGIMRDCRRVLKPGGTLVVSVPDAYYFRSVYQEDNIKNAVGLFGEPIYEPDGEITFFDYALWMRQHHAILTEDSLWCYFVKAGFNYNGIETCFNTSPRFPQFKDLLNRIPFSLIMTATK